MKTLNITKTQIDKIKIIVFDLDGTLLNHKKEIPPKTVDYLIKLQQTGYILVLATGRFFYELKKYIELLQMDKYHGYIACCNGLEIHDLTANKIHNFDYLTASDIKPLVKMGLAAKLNLRANFNNRYEMVINRWAFCLVPFIKLAAKRYPDLTFFHTNEPVSWNKLGKLCFLSTNKKLKSFIKEVDCKYPNQYQYYFTHANCIELVKSNVNKYLGISYICKQNNLSLENVLAFGDSGNDEQLLKNAGIGIFMKNGYYKIKRKMPNISFKTNFNEGVLDTLQYLFKDVI